MRVRSLWLVLSMVVSEPTLTRKVLGGKGNRHEANGGNPETLSNHRNTNASRGETTACEIDKECRRNRTAKANHGLSIPWKNLVSIISSPATLSIEVFSIFIDFS